MQSAKAWEIATSRDQYHWRELGITGGVTEGAIDRARLLYELGRARPLTCRCFQMGRGPFRFHRNLSAVYHGSVNLPVNPPVLPMLAKRVAELPGGHDWVFEPKWDGFRALVFRDRDEVFIQSRDEKPLNRYFPELVPPLLSALPARCVLDGEIVMVKNNQLDFDLLQLRLHPAASRVKLLSQQTPASFVFFDLLCLGDRDLRSEPFEARRRELEKLISSASPPIHLTPATRDRIVAADWFRRFEGAG